MPFRLVGTPRAHARISLLAKTECLFMSQVHRLTTASFFSCQRSAESCSRSAARTPPSIRRAGMCRHVPACSGMCRRVPVPFPMYSTHSDNVQNGLVRILLAENFKSGNTAMDSTTEIRKVKYICVGRKLPTLRRRSGESQLLSFRCVTAGLVLRSAGKED